MVLDRLTKLESLINSMEITSVDEEINRKSLSTWLDENGEKMVDLYNRGKWNELDLMYYIEFIDEELDMQYPKDLLVRLDQLYTYLKGVS